MKDEISLGITKANIKKSNASIIFLKNFIRIPTAVFGSIFVFCTFFSAIFAAWIVPYDPNVMDYNFLLSGMSYIQNKSYDNAITVLNTGKMIVFEKSSNTLVFL